MTSKTARHAPTSRARVILTSHLWPMYQKSSPTRQLIHRGTVTGAGISWTDKEIRNCACKCVHTGKPEVGLDGAYRCRGGGSSQSDRQRNSCSWPRLTGTHICSPRGTAVTSHTRHPADLEGGSVKGLLASFQFNVCVRVSPSLSVALGPEPHSRQLKNS